MADEPGGLLAVDAPELDAAWQGTLDLAWASFRGGTTPVGAVVVDASGAVIASGRGRRFETSGPSGQLAGTHVAHAELNVLAMLPSSRRWEDETLLTSLEPCLMCHGAAIQTTVRRICFAAPDPFAGTARVRTDTPQAQGRPLRIDGPLLDERGAIAAILHLAWLFDRKATRPLRAHEVAMPAMTSFVEGVRAGLADASSRDAFGDVVAIARRAPRDELARSSG